ncbi:NAD(P)/FAD-dependent oxidoreductase [Spongiivirga citrea]|uniref:FAD-dependent oxidoreductase n=1 Tax=Spongiivirga citrea TaxID=1481457 RepID=A0A6M0CH92_9FLAO|nr:FAD-dependent oxidoreductase [Spongiivirga citrea]NER17308.1 FAD-dependent oxidoreductase [Spongiivirga citrea]
MQLSYWEHKTWLSNIDFTIVGSGIVGLSCALQLKEQYPTSKVLILEKGVLPQGASTKNAGFACFGSASELLDDLNSHTEDEVVKLVEKRWKGLAALRKTIGDTNLNFESNGGYELFTDTDTELQEMCLDKIPYLNELLNPIFNEEVFSIRKNEFGFEKVEPNLIFNQFEGQIDTGKMMSSLLEKARKNGIFILNNVLVQDYQDQEERVHVNTDQFQLTTRKLLIATNGFSSKLGIHKVKPARAQVLITKPIKDLHIKGTFHLDRGYYYFRNVDNRILFGGGRNLDFKGETTTDLEVTTQIQNKLEELLRTTILPNDDFEIDRRWSGIMGVENQKEAIVKPVSDNVLCGVRLGGMGVAIGSLIGRELAELVS